MQGVLLDFDNGLLVLVVRPQRWTFGCRRHRVLSCSETARQGSPQELQEVMKAAEQEHGRSVGLPGEFNGGD